MQGDRNRKIPLLNLKERLKEILLYFTEEGGRIFFIGLLSVAWSGDCWEL